MTDRGETVLGYFNYGAGVVSAGLESHFSIIQDNPLVAHAGIGDRFVVRYGPVAVTGALAAVQLSNGNIESAASTVMNGVGSYYGGAMALGAVEGLGLGWGWTTAAVVGGGLLGGLAVSGAVVGLAFAMEALPEGISQYDIMQTREDEVAAAHPNIPEAVMDEVFAAEADRLNSPSGPEHGYMEDPATQAMLDRLDSRFALVQGNPLAIEIMARRELEAMEFVNGLDRAAAEASSPSSGGGGSGGGSGGGNGNDPDGPGTTGGTGITTGGELSAQTGGTTGTFTPPGTWSDGGDHGTPDPGLPVNPDYTGIQPVILDLDGDGVEIAVNAQISFDWDGDGFLESSNWAAVDDGFLVVDLEAANLPVAPLRNAA